MKSKTCGSEGFRTIFSFAVLAVFVVALAGCSSYQWILVEQSVRARTMPNVSPTGDPATGFLRQIGKKPTVAFRTPDFCLDRSASGATGTPQVDKEFLRTFCSVWMTEMERPFLADGYPVVNWSAITARRDLAYFDGDNAFRAAEAKKVDVLFMVNSLDSGGVEPGSSQETEFSYFTSDDEGRRGAPIALDEKSRASIKSQVPPNVSLPQRQVMYHFQIQAVWTKNDHTIWAYDQPIYREDAQTGNWQGLFYCYDDGTCYPYNLEPVAVTDEKAKESMQTSTPPRPHDPAQHDWYTILKKAMKNVVVAFSQGL